MLIGNTVFYWRIIKIRTIDTVNLLRHMHNSTINYYLILFSVLLIINLSWTLQEDLLKMLWKYIPPSWPENALKILHDFITLLTCLFKDADATVAGGSVMLCSGNILDIVKNERIPSSTHKPTHVCSEWPVNVRNATIIIRTRSFVTSSTRVAFRQPH